jgi:hypothetical protein
MLSSYGSHSPLLASDGRAKKKRVGSPAARIRGSGPLGSEAGGDTPAALGSGLAASSVAASFEAV